MRSRSSKNCHFTFLSSSISHISLSFIQKAQIHTTDGKPQDMPHKTNLNMQGSLLESPYSEKDFLTRADCIYFPNTLTLNIDFKTFSP